MDRHARQTVGNASSAATRWGLALGLLLLTLASGCVGTDPFVVPGLTEKPAPVVTQVVAMWNNQVVTGVDPTHNGAPMHGLAGRVYLFGSDWKNVTADGRLVVEMYGVLPGQAQGQPVRLETWEIKKDVLNGVYRRTDGIGPGYSLSLPWPGYRADISQVQLWVRYEPEKGLPVSAINGVTLNSGPEATPVYTNRMETGNRQPIATAPPSPVPQAGAVQQQPVLQPAAGMPPPGAVQPIGGIAPPSAPQAGTGYQPACTVQPAGGALSPRQAAFQLPSQQPAQAPLMPPPGSYQQPQYQTPQQQGSLPR